MFSSQVVSFVLPLFLEFQFEDLKVIILLWLFSMVVYIYRNCKLLKVLFIEKWYQNQTIYKNDGILSNILRFRTPQQ